VGYLPRRRQAQCTDRRTRLALFTRLETAGTSFCASIIRGNAAQLYVFVCRCLSRPKLQQIYYPVYETCEELVARRNENMSSLRMQIASRTYTRTASRIAA
jgi:hypothetical protein